MQHAPTPSLLTFDVQRLHHVVVDELKVLVADPVLHVPLPAREEVVHHGHLVAVHHQLVSEVGAHEARAARDLGTGRKNANRESRPVHSSTAASADG